MVTCMVLRLCALVVTTTGVQQFPGLVFSPRSEGI